MEGESFCQLGELERRVFNDKVILHCASVTGCTLPLTDGFADIICENLSEMMDEFGYRELTFAEIKLALKLNYSHHLKTPQLDEGKKVFFVGCFNVGFMMEILFNYMIFRNHLDRIFQNQIDGY